MNRLTISSNDLKKKSIKKAPKKTSPEEPKPEDLVDCELEDCEEREEREEREECKLGSETPDEASGANATTDVKFQAKVKFKTPKPSVKLGLPEEEYEYPQSTKKLPVGETMASLMLAHYTEGFKKLQKGAHELGLEYKKPGTVIGVMTDFEHGSLDVYIAKLAKAKAKAEAKAEAKAAKPKAKTRTVVDDSAGGRARRAAITKKLMDDIKTAIVDGDALRGLTAEQRDKQKASNLMAILDGKQKHLKTLKEEKLAEIQDRVCPYLTDDEKAAIFDVDATAGMDNENDVEDAEDAEDAEVASHGTKRKADSDLDESMDDDDSESDSDEEDEEEEPSSPKVSSSSPKAPPTQTADHITAKKARPKTSPNAVDAMHIA